VELVEPIFLGAYIGRTMAVLTEELFELLRARILAGEIAAGSRLPPERELAVRYGTNRNTLREAIRRLEQAKLVTVRQGQGVTVADFRSVGGIELLGPFVEHVSDPVERAQVVLDLLEPRAKVIDFLVERAAQSARSADEPALHATEIKVRAAEAARDATAYILAQHAYLDALVDAAHSLPMRWVANPLLGATRDLLLRQSHMMLWSPSFADMAAEVNAAIALNDVERARAACARFHHEVDAVLRVLLTPLAERGALHG
jgi:DNA-binding FadR family transcriptional regulator